MTLWGSGRLTALIGAAVFVAGCGGAGSTGVPRGVTAQAHRATSGDLLYVVSSKVVYFVSYPSGEPVGQLTGFGTPSHLYGLCSDNKGDVFVTGALQGNQWEVVEFAHGGTTPINTFPVNASSCSWDPTTGNLALVGFSNTVTIYQNATGSGQIFTDSGSSRISYCAYDNSGRLFVERAPTGGNTPLASFNGTSFSNITVNQQIPYGNFQWDGKYLAINSGARHKAQINRVQVSGSSGTVVGTVALSHRITLSGWSWIQDGTFIAPTGSSHNRAVDLWSYPAGGNPIEQIPGSVFEGRGGIEGITVSVAP